MTRTRQHRTEIRDAIRKAAITEFSQHGFEGASTQAIAERAGLTKSLLHYYIEDKEALYTEVLANLMQKWTNLLEFAEGRKPAEILTDYVRQKLKFTFENPELSRIFTTELLSGGHRLEPFWEASIANLDRKAATIDRWIKAGELKPLDAKLFIMHIWAMTQYYADYAVQIEKMLGKSLDTARVRNRVETELINFVLAGCGLASK